MYNNNAVKILRINRKLLVNVMIVIVSLSVIVPVSTISLFVQSVSGQTTDGGNFSGGSNNNSGISSSSTNANNNKTSGSLNRTGFTDVTNLMINGKTYPIKYNITGGKLLGIVADNGRVTLVAIMSAGGNGGKLVIELPRNVLDSKALGNADSKYQIKIDDKGVDYKENGNSDKARILEIDFSKDNRIIEIIGTKIAS
jgi:hypothetical protein